MDFITDDPVDAVAMTTIATTTTITTTPGRDQSRRPRPFTTTSPNQVPTSADTTTNVNGHRDRGP